jgi:hypothetical protein
MITGVGEFERNSMHVVATVEVRTGVICGVGFAVDGKSDSPAANSVTALLIDRPVSEALAVNAGPDYFVGQGQDLEVREVLLEAFHRAVESCLDQQ